MGTTTYGYAYDAIGRRAGSGSTSEAVPYAASGRNRCTHITSQASTSNVYGLDLHDSLHGTDTIGDHLSGIFSTSSMVAFYSYDAAGTHYECAPRDRTTEARHPLASANPWHFSTKQADDWGLYYYGLRFYSPEIGRWCSRDPLGDRVVFLNYTRARRTSPTDYLRLEAESRMPCYLFVRGNPVSAFDALGLECNIDIAVKHLTTLTDWFNKDKPKPPGKCDKWGAITCGEFTVNNLATNDWHGTWWQMSPWPNQSGVMYCTHQQWVAGGSKPDETSVQDEWSKIKQGIGNGADQLCGMCCCKKVTVKFDCEKGDPADCMATLKTMGVIPIDYCRQKTLTMDCPKGASPNPK